MENKRIRFADISDGGMKRWWTIQHKETRKNPQNVQERSSCVRFEKLFGGLQNK